MARPKPKFYEADAVRAVKAARKAGAVVEIEDGVIRLIPVEKTETLDEHEEINL